MNTSNFYSFSISYDRSKVKAFDAGVLALGFTGRSQHRKVFDLIPLRFYSIPILVPL